MQSIYRASPQTLESEHWFLYASGFPVLNALICTIPKMHKKYVS